MEEVLIGVNLKVGVSPSSKRKVEKKVATESKQDLQITIFRTMKKLLISNVTVFGIPVSRVLFKSALDDVIKIH